MAVGNSESKTTIKRSRKGCHNCKRLKIKCDEDKPKCSYCVKTNSDCDYSIKLTWGGRPYKDVSKRKNPFETVISTNPQSPSIKKTKKTKTKSGGGVKFVMDKNSDLAFSTPRSLPLGMSDSIVSLDLLELGNNSYNSLNTGSFNTTNSLAESLQPSNSIGSEPNFMSSALRTTISQSDSNFEINGMMSKSSQMGSEKTVEELDGKTKIKNEPIFGNSPGLSEFITQDNDIPVLSPLPPFSNPKIASEYNSVNGYSPQNIIADDFAKPKFSPSSQHHSNYKPDSRKDSFTSLVNSFPYLSSGIENLSNALEKVADGGNQFSLQNSEIFNKFLNSIEDRKSPISFENSPNYSILSPELNKLQISKIDDEFINNYSTDLAKSEAYVLNSRKNAFRQESPVSIFEIASLMKNSNKIKDILDNDDNELPLDYENSPSSSISSTFINGLESIPPLLIPLPELLNQVPYYRQLMHFWVNTAADNLVPAPKHIYQDNPFKVLLPQMAMEYPAILTTILAFAAKSMSSITRSEAPTEIVDQLIARSCNMLLKMLKDKDEATSDGTLATVLLLSCYEVLSTNDFAKHRAHTLGARQIIKARRLKNKPTFIEFETKLNDSPDSNSLSRDSIAGTEGDVTFFLMRWFVYVDVIGALSATTQSEYYLSQNDGNETNYLPAESVNNLNSMDSALHNIDPKRDIDYVLGFDVKFLPHLSKTVMLIRRVNEYLDEENKDVLPIDILTEALEVKSKLTKAYEEGEARRQERIDKISNFDTIETSPRELSKKHKRVSRLIQQDNVLRCTNKLFYNMGLLNLYRRVLQIPRSSLIVQELANEIGNILAGNIESGSSAEICSIFCLFCAGCETLDHDMRELFSDRFTKLSEMGNVLALKSFKIMQRCWQSGEDWIQASKTLDIDITLL